MAMSSMRRIEAQAFNIWKILHHSSAKKSHINVPIVEDDGGENLNDVDEGVLKWADFGQDQIPNRILIRDMVSQQKMDSIKIN